MRIVLALLPILAALTLMIGFRVRPGRAMPTAWLLAAAIAWGVWGVPARAVAAAGAQGVLKSLDIILIIYGAILLLNVLRESGAFRRLNYSLAGVSADRRIQVLVIAWMFGGFVEGAAGFGAAPALAAPLLAGLGFPAVTAVAVALICNTLPVPFGAVGLPEMTSIAAVGDKLAAMGVSEAKFSKEVLDNLTLTSGFSGLFIPLLAVTVMILLSSGGRKLRSIAEIAPLAVLAGAAYVIPWRLTALRLGPELPSMMGALVGLPTLLLAVKTRFLVPKYVWEFPEAEQAPAAEAEAAPMMPLLQAWAPYLTLAAGLLILRLPQLPFRGWLDAATLRVPDLFGAAHTGIVWKMLNNPGLLPFIPIAAVSAAAWRFPWRRQLTLWRDTERQIRPAAIAIAASVAVVQIMVHSADNPAGTPGMLDCVARGMAALLGRAYLLGAPCIGVFGTFFAGSCTVSNILFAPLQFDTARMLELSVPLVVALQNAGGGIGSMIRISGVIAACATVGISGKEGRIILINSLPAVLVILLVLAAALTI